MMDKVKQLAKVGKEELIAIRRHLHQYPELSFQEVKTGHFIAEKLTTYGIPFSQGWAGTGIVGIIEGQRPSSGVLALRADIDALPITELNDKPYRSAHDGIMHACGHDVHTTCLLGAAKILQSMRHEWSGTIKLIFQPGEEMAPGGASIMIEQGVLKNPEPQAILGQHVHPPLPVGKIGIRSGKSMASADEIFVTIKGRGGHGALPHQCIDPILIAAHIITGLQQVVSRRADPTIPSVLTFGKIESIGGATNVITEEVKMMGTFRTFDETWRAEALHIMKNMAETIAKAMGGECDYNIMKGYPALINDESLTQDLRQYAQAYMGKENVEELPIRMTAEDFAFYSQVIPAGFYRLGVGNPAKAIQSPVHTPTFDVDEDCLPIGAGLMAWLAVCVLGAMRG